MSDEFNDDTEVYEAVYVDTAHEGISKKVIDQVLLFIAVLGTLIIECWR